MEGDPKGVVRRATMVDLENLYDFLVANHPEQWEGRMIMNTFTGPLYHRICKGSALVLVEYDDQSQMCGFVVASLFADEIYLRGMTNFSQNLLKYLLDMVEDSDSIFTKVRVLVPFMKGYDNIPDVLVENGFVYVDRFCANGESMPSDDGCDATMDGKELFTFVYRARNKVKQ